MLFLLLAPNFVHLQKSHQPTSFESDSAVVAAAAVAVVVAVAAVAVVAAAAVAVAVVAAVAKSVGLKKPDFAVVSIFFREIDFERKMILCLGCNFFASVRAAPQRRQHALPGHGRVGGGGGGGKADKTSLNPNL